MNFSICIISNLTIPVVNGDFQNFALKTLLKLELLNRPLNAKLICTTKYAL